MEWLESLVLGVVQGITEFLPVSSDGHLLLTQNLFAWLTGVAKTGKENLFFDVILHLGTTAAILVHYRGAIAQGIRGLGETAKLGGSLIVMAIIGGAVLTPVMGLLSIHFGGLAVAYLVPALAYVLIAFCSFADLWLAKSDPSSLIAREA